MRPSCAGVFLFSAADECQEGGFASQGDHQEDHLGRCGRHVARARGFAVFRAGLALSPHRPAGHPLDTLKCASVRVRVTGSSPQEPEFACRPWRSSRASRRRTRARLTLHSRPSAARDRLRFTKGEEPAPRTRCTGSRAPQHDGPSGWRHPHVRHVLLRLRCWAADVHHQRNFYAHVGVGCGPHRCGRRGQRYIQVRDCGGGRVVAVLFSAWSAARRS